MALLLAHTDISGQHKTLSGFLLTKIFCSMALLLAHTDISGQHKTLTGLGAELDGHNLPLHQIINSSSLLSALSALSSAALTPAVLANLPSNQHQSPRRWILNPLAARAQLLCLPIKPELSSSFNTFCHLRESTKESVRASNSFLLLCQKNQHSSSSSFPLKPDLQAPSNPSKSIPQTH